MNTYLRAMLDLFKPKVKYVLIHQMGKVASQTIEQTIRAADPELRVERLHFLRQTGITAEQMLANVAHEPEEYKQSVLFQLNAREKCFRELMELKQQRVPLCVVTGCRDPLNHAIASVFQNMEIYVPQVTLDPAKVESECTLVDHTIHDMFLRYQTNSLGRSYREQSFSTIFHYSMNWFDKEFMTVHGVDLYEHKPNKHGLLVLDQKSTRYILYKLETLEQQLSNVLKLIPGLPRRIPAVHRNRAQEKPYAALYSLFRKRFTPTPAMIDHFYHSRYFQHFYAGAKPRFMADLRQRAAA
jgi:hypothetical protein